MIYKNNGNGEFSYSQNIDAAVNGGNVMVGDFDGDGDLDIVGNFNDLRLYKNNGGGVFTYAFSSFGGGTLGDIGDLDADGDLDIALCSGNQIRWYLNDGDGNFTERSITFFDINQFPPFVINLNVGDMDNDGDLDFTTVVIQIHSPQYTDFKTLYNDGNANFGNAAYMSAYFYNSVAADLEGDNDLDILSNTVKYFNNGNGTFTPSAFSSNTNSDIIPADYDGDGDIDAAFTDMGSDKVRLFKNNSAGSLNFFANSTCGNNPDQGTSGDFDGDGDIDLTVINNMGHGDNTSDISLLKNNYNYSPAPLTAILPHPDGDGTLNEVAEFVYEKEYYPNYPNDTIFKPLVCGSNQYIIVDPCNPWVQTFYVAFWEIYPGGVKIQDININWDTTQCQDIRFEYIYPPDPDTNVYSDSIVIKVTMIPHPIDGCIPDSVTHPPQPWFEGRGFICQTGDTIYNYNCWHDCLNERLTFTVVDSNPVPNVVTCYLDWDKPLSVELVSFTTAVSGNNVILNWTTSEEKNNKGFTLQRSSGGKWMDVGFVDGKGNSASLADYTFTDRNVNSGLYNYRMKQIDFNGSFEYLILENPVTVGAPDKFTLLQNYPNPFNPATTIVYGIPKDGHVSLKLYDMNGREIRTLVNEPKSSGYYSITFSIGDLSSGIYFYKLESGNYIAAKKLVLIK